jgi:hypothetical protein
MAAERFPRIGQKQRQIDIAGFLHRFRENVVIRYTVRGMFSEENIHENSVRFGKMFEQRSIHLAGPWPGNVLAGERRDAFLIDRNDDDMVR